MPFKLVLLPTAFSLDTEQPDYDLDSEDETFVNKLKKKMDVGALQFEEMIDRLEKGSGQQVTVVGRTGNCQKIWILVVVLNLSLFFQGCYGADLYC